MSTTWTVTSTDTALRSAIDRYGEHSAVFGLWASIHPDYRADGGTRRVLVMDRSTGATVLAPWYGPPPGAIKGDVSTS